MPTSPDKLDLADLDLSQLRLSKKDLETLSLLTPELPKHLQDQLLAQLPPEQARKLSRTLSMQSPSKSVAPHIYKRSLSGSRDIATVNENAMNSLPIDRRNGELDEQLKLITNPVTRTTTPSKSDVSHLPELSGSDRNSIMRRSLSRGRCTSRNVEPTNRFSYSGDIKSSDSDFGLPVSLRNSRPPPRGGCLSPPPTDSTESPARRRSLQKRISRFLRPDFYDAQPSSMEDNYFVRAKNERERETQTVLREIRERSRDRMRDRSHDRIYQRESSVDTAYLNPDNNCHDYDSKLADIRSLANREKRKNSIPNIRTPDADTIPKGSYARNVDFYQTPHEKQMPKIEDHKNHIIADVIKTNDNSAILNNSADVVNQNEKKSSPVNMKTGQTDQSSESTSDLTVKKVKVKVKSDKSEAKPKKLKAIVTSVVIDTPILSNVNNIEMVTQLTSEIDSVTLPLKVSKLARPKSYSSKEMSCDRSDSNQSAATQQTEAEDDHMKKAPINKSIKNTTSNEIPITGIKNTARTSAAISSLTSTRNSITGVVEKLIEKGAERLSPSKGATAKAKIDSHTLDNPMPLVKKKVKIVKKKVKEDASTNTIQKSELPTKTNTEIKEKSPEKKTKGGFLYSIGQKFERIRENSRNKEKKTQRSGDKTASKIEQNSLPKTFVEIQSTPTITLSEDDLSTNSHPAMSSVASAEAPLQTNELSAGSSTPSASASATVKSDQRKAKIDSMIRNLRERSLTHSIVAETRENSAPPTESGLIKRAVSVEDLSKGITNFNRCNVNKVLCMFKSIENDRMQKKHDNIEHIHTNTNDNKERPRSGGFISKLKKGRPYYTGAKSDTIVTLADKFASQMLIDKVDQQLAANSRIPKPTAVPSSNNNACHECVHLQTTTNDSDIVDKWQEPIISSMDHSTSDNATLRSLSSNDRERIRNNRKALVLDLNNAHFDSNSFESKLNNNIDLSSNNNNNNHSSNCSMNRCQHKDNNNGIACNDTSESKLSAYDMATNYLSDSKSLNDDGASSSTFLSPTDETDIHDDWSVYSGTHFPIFLLDEKNPSNGNRTFFLQAHQRMKTLACHRYLQNNPITNPLGTHSTVDHIIPINLPLYQNYRSETPIYPIRIHPIRKVLSIVSNAAATIAVSMRDGPSAQVQLLDQRRVNIIVI